MLQSVSSGIKIQPLLRNVCVNVTWVCRGETSANPVSLTGKNKIGIRIPILILHKQFNTWVIYVALAASYFFQKPRARLSCAPRARASTVLV